MIALSCTANRRVSKELSPKNDSNWPQVSRLVFGNEPELEHSVNILELETNDEVSPFQFF